MCVGFTENLGCGINERYLPVIEPVHSARRQSLCWRNYPNLRHSVPCAYTTAGISFRFTMRTVPRIAGRSPYERRRRKHETFRRLRHVSACFSVWCHVRCSLGFSMSLRCKGNDFFGLFLGSASSHDQLVLRTRTLEMTALNAVIINPLKPRGNYIYHRLLQSLTLHFVCMDW
jgi:hypothetical protein